MDEDEVEASKAVEDGEVTDQPNEDHTAVNGDSERINSLRKRKIQSPSLSPTKANLQNGNMESEIDKEKQFEITEIKYKFPGHLSHSVGAIDKANRRTILKMSTAGSIESGETHGTYIGVEQKRFVVLVSFKIIINYYNSFILIYNSFILIIHLFNRMILKIHQSTHVHALINPL